MTEETSKPTPEIQKLIQKAEIPAGSNFEEAYQRLHGKAGMSEEDAEHWARILTSETA